MAELLMFLENYGVLVFTLLMAAVCLLVYHIRSSRPPVTGPATVLSSRTEPAKFPTGGAYAKTNNWNYLVTFRLADGEELELYTSGTEYTELNEGLSGQLTWHGDNFVNFE